MGKTKFLRPAAADPGLFITFEGPEGAGKTTQLCLLAEVFEARGITCCRTREPGGTPLAEAIRAVVKGEHGEIVAPETELLLMEAARAQHVARVILPALEAGDAVLCDRFADSTTAYQGGARGLDRELVGRVNTFAMHGREPDLTLLLDLPVEAGFDRAGRRSETQGQFDRFESETLDFHHRVRQTFLALAAAEPARFIVVDADRPAAEIHREILDRVERHARFADWMKLRSVK